MRFVIYMKISSILVQFQLCSSISSEVMLKERMLMGGGCYSSEGAGWALEAAG